MSMDRRDYWERCAGRRPPQHRAVQAFALPKVGYIRTAISEEGEDLSRLTLLDVGCGNGFFTYYFERVLRSVGVDSSQHMLSINPCRIRVRGSSPDLPFKDSSFDIVFSSNLLHHVRDPLSTVREMARLSRKFLILIEPNGENPLMRIFSLLKREERMVRKFSIGCLRQLVLSTGFDLISSATLGMITPNRTPASFLPLLGLLPEKCDLGLYNICIARAGTRCSRV